MTNTIYALDSTTIDRCLSLFDWAPFRSTKAAVKMHTLLDLRGSIPAFSHLSDGKFHAVNVLDILPTEAGSDASGRCVLRHAQQAWHGRPARVLGDDRPRHRRDLCAVSTYVLIAIVKKELQLNASLYTLLQILSVSVFDKIPLNKAFLDTTDTTNQDASCNQLNLFNY